MTPNKLPPLPERVALTKLFAPWFIASLGDLTDDYAAMTLDDVEMALLANGEYILPIIEALRQSQSLPAGAVAGLVGKWREEAEKLRKGGGRAQRRGDLADADVAFTAAQDACAYADELEQALQADAREKGEAVFRLYPEELARMTHGPSLRAEEEDRLRSIYGDVAIPLYLHSGDYTEAMLLLEKQRELVENLRGQLDDAKADATDGCTEANCERCNTAIHSRGDMRHAGIGTYPATQPAQASEKAPSDDYQRGFHDGYERRHLEVLGALV